MISKKLKKNEVPTRPNKIRKIVPVTRPDSRVNPTRGQLGWVMVDEDTQKQKLFSFKALRL